MHIEIHIFTSALSDGPSSVFYQDSLAHLMNRIHATISEATVSKHSGAHGKYTLLDEHNGYIQATIDIRRE